MTLASVFAACMVTGSATGNPYPGYVVGNVIDITSTTAGLMMRMEDSRVPTLCGASSYGWMLVPQSNSAMISVFLTYWASGKKNFTIYIDQTAGSACIVDQIDPVD